MSYFPDLHTACMLGSGEYVRAVGWLHRDFEYARGPVSPQELSLLKTHIASAFQSCAFGGFHECEFCDKAHGISHLIVPTSDVVYVAPEMIVHYITEHGYRPPDQFFTALASCPEQESPQYMRLLAPFYSSLRMKKGDPLPTPEQQVRLARLISRALKDVRRLCYQGNSKAAEALADAFAEMPEQIAGWGLWYRCIFSRLVRNGRDAYPQLDDYLKEYNDIFGGDTDPRVLVDLFMNLFNSPAELENCHTLKASRDFFDDDWTYEQVAVIEQEFARDFRAAAAQVEAEWGPPEFLGHRRDSQFPNFRTAEELCYWRRGDEFAVIWWEHQDKEVPVLLKLAVLARADLAPENE